MENLDVMDIKQNNMKSVINVLRCHSDGAGLTKRDIASKTGLSFATVSNLCNELLEKRIVELVKKDAASVGRTPFAVSLAYNKFRTVCLNLQMQGVLRLAVLNIKNEMIYNCFYDLNGMDSPEKVIHFAKDKFDEYVKKDGNPENTYIGIGVAVSGIFDLATQTLVNCAVKMYEGVKLKAIIESVFGLPGYVDNESNLCALSLMQKYKNCRDLVYLHFSEGVGVGIICNGSLLRGYHGYGGEVSHIPIGDKTKKCKECGFYGCIENDLSVPSIVKAYFHGEQENVLDAWEKFTQDVKRKESSALKFVHVIAHHLSELLATLIFVLDPEYLYVGGELAQIYDLLYPEISKAIKERCCLYGNRNIKIIKDDKSDMTINSGISEAIFSNWKG
ncbi:MAG: ROK family transcriptional regulator [Blautia sp.]|nr:ROK family transcriptional regulator [Blautia sp.]